MRTILLWALFMVNYNLFAPDFDDGLCFEVPGWIWWSLLPLLLITLLLDIRAVVLRYYRLTLWRTERQRYLRMRNWVRLHFGADGVI